MEWGGFVEAIRGERSIGETVHDLIDSIEGRWGKVLSVKYSCQSVLVLIISMTYVGIGLSLGFVYGTYLQVYHVFSFKSVAELRIFWIVSSKNRRKRKSERQNHMTFMECTPFWS